MLKIHHTPKYKQAELGFDPWSGDITQGGQCRALMGMRVEDFVCKTLDLTPIPTSGKYDVNFDAGQYNKQGRQTFFEIKSLRYGGKSPLYVFRLDKEVKAQCEALAPVVYVFCVHNIKNIEDQAQITTALKYSRFYMMTLNDVLWATKPFDIQRINSEAGAGYNRKGYCEGYINLPYKDIVKMCDFSGFTREGIDVYLSKNVCKVIERR